MRAARRGTLLPQPPCQRVKSGSTSRSGRPERGGSGRLEAAGLLRRLGEKGIDAATRLVGFFVSAMGMGLIFHGLTDVLSSYGITPK